MPYSQEIYHIAKERLSERRQQALRMADFNREQLFKEIPRLSEINSELLSIGAAIAKAVVTNKPGENEKLRQLSEKSLQLQDEQKKLLVPATSKKITAPLCATACKSSWLTSRVNSSAPTCR